MRLAASIDEASRLRPATPKVVLVGPPAEHVVASGRRVGATDVDFVARMLSMGAPHHVAQRVEGGGKADQILFRGFDSDHGTDFAVFIDGQVLQQGVPLNSIVNIRFAFFIKIDAFGITSPFKIEDAFIVPSMLIITNKRTFWIC